MNSNTLPINQGEKLTRHELKERLQEMNVKLDENNSQKSSLITEYNKQLMDQSSRQMIIDRLTKDTDDEKNRALIRNKRRTLFIQANHIESNEITKEPVNAPLDSINQLALSQMRYSMFKIPKKSIMTENNIEFDTSKSLSNSNVEEKKETIELKAPALLNNTKQALTGKQTAEKIIFPISSANHQALNGSKLSQRQSIIKLNDDVKKNDEKVPPEAPEDEALGTKEDSKEDNEIQDFCSLNKNNADEKPMKEIVPQLNSKRENIIYIKESANNCNDTTESQYVNRVNEPEVFYWKDSNEQHNSQDFNPHDLLLNQIENKMKRTSLTDTSFNKCSKVNIDFQVKPEENETSFKLLAYGFGVGAFVVGAYYCIKTNIAISNTANESTSNEPISGLSNIILEAFKTGVISLIQKPIQHLISLLSSSLLCLGQTIFWDNLKLTVLLVMFLSIGYYLWKEHKDKQLIQIIFNSIKDDLLLINDSKFDINSGLSEQDIIKYYSIHFGYSEQSFNKKIMPKLRALRTKDEKIKEFEVVVNNKVQRVWQWCNY